MIYKSDLLPRFVLLLVSLVSQATFTVFAQKESIKFGETFTLRSGETAETSDAKLKVRLLGVGRAISEGGEVEYVELQIAARGTERKIVISERGNSAKTVGGYTIILVNAESFGKARCQLKVSRRK